MIDLAPRRRLVMRVLQLLMLCLLGVYVILLAPPLGGNPRHWSAPRELWLFSATLALAVIVTGLRAVLVPDERVAWACIAAAGACWTAGSVYFLIVIRPRTPMPSPTWADLGFFAFYPLAWCGIALLLRKRSGLFHVNLWLNGLVAGLAAAALAAVALPTIVDATSAPFGTVATNLSYPVGDLLLLCGVVFGCALFAWRPPALLLMLGAGMAAFALSDTVFLLQVSTGAFQPGSIWGIGWPIGFALIALAAWRPGSARTRVRPAAKLDLAIPLFSSLLGLGLLTYGALNRLPVVTVLLATGCVLTGLARTTLTLGDTRALSSARHEARTDELTGLANRRHFYARLAEALAPPLTEERLAVMIIDLDRFKEVNDSLGHHVGDSLMRMVGQRLAGALRPDDLLARLGGDEFAVLVVNVDRIAAEATAKRLRDAIQAPFVLDVRTLHLNASFGIALVPDHGVEVDQLLQRADVAMYLAKATGSGVETYLPEGDSKIADRLDTTEELRTALYNDDLILHYQPKITVETGEVAGVEALVRWQHPQRGLIYPDDFLPLAEAAGLMPALTTVVLDQALRQCAAWRSSGVNLSVAVNLSASDLLDTELASLIEALLANLDLPPSVLHLEITETVLLTDRDRRRSIPILERFAEIGLRVAIDDYGTGYCSLVYLAELPVHDLKLDKSFIKAMDGEGLAARRATSIVTSTISLAHGLGLGFVAEGVETARALSTLTALGCETVQGYYLSPPLPPQELIAWLVSRGDIPAATTTSSTFDAVGASVSPVGWASKVHSTALTPPR